KVIYFAAYMIISVDQEARHERLPQLEQELRLKVGEVEKRRDADIAARLSQLEADVAQLEEEGAKADQKRKVKDAGEREMAQLRKFADDEIAQMEKVFDDFRTLKVGDLKAEDATYHDL